jgi:uncharacterized membrane protein
MKTIDPQAEAGATRQRRAGLDVQRVVRFERDANPVLVRHAEERAQSIQNRIADRITAFAGSMWFVYIHIAWFGCWIGLGVERYPYGLLTMIVSLEAIFLSTFVMISQNRADENAGRSPTSAGRRSRKRTRRTRSCSSSRVRSSS